jgi:hypothetical protein
LCQEWFSKTFGHHQKIATLFKISILVEKNKKKKDETLKKENSEGWKVEIKERKKERKKDFVFLHHISCTCSVYINGLLF